MSGLLTGSLGETIHIEYKIDADLWHAFADAGQVENALLNLAINARDAMPEGGLLTIKCSNIHWDDDYAASMQEPSDFYRSDRLPMPIRSGFKSGDYVSLSIIDDGHGMTEEVLSQAFEPFFTTKEIGAGTGLGLPMVYSFAKESGGHVVVSSKPGVGTHSTLYLKRADQLRHSNLEVEEKLENEHHKGGRILLLEDDEGVRNLILLMLDELGYLKAVATSRSSEAEKALAQGASFDLLLSDVVLPGGSSGPEFARQALVKYPELKCIFIAYSGEVEH